jgi:hypothetical protein
MSITADPRVFLNQITIQRLTISALSSRLAGGFFDFSNDRSQSLSLEVTSVSKFSVCISLCLLALGSSFASAQSATHATRQPIAVPSGYFATLKAAPKHTASNKLSAATNAATANADPRIVSMPNFTSSFIFGGVTYPYTMVGQNPKARQTTVVPTTYVPMSFFFDEFVDQNGNNITIDTTAITKEIKNSPLFENSSYATGNTQFEDAVMRAEFYPLFNKNGDNDGDDNYHVLLGTPQTLTPVTIEVPVGSSVLYEDGNGTFFAVIDINFINSQLNTLTQTEGISVQSIPIFLTRNAVYGDFLNGMWIDCCIGGYHGAFEVNSTASKIFVQTFAFSTSLDSDVADAIFGDPGVFSDVNALSHELGETFNDPFTNNATPNYQLPGAPAGTCQNILEVGDVVENLTPDYTDVTVDGFTYHPQTLGLLQWFEGISPSNAINGDYSFPDSTRLTAPFTPCPTS